MGHRALVNRGDLLRALASSRRETGPADHAIVAELLGFHLEGRSRMDSRSPVAPRDEGFVPTTGRTPRRAAPQETPPRPAAEYFVPIRAEYREPALKPPDTVELFDVPQLSSKVKAPPPPPLLPWRRLWPWLRQALGAWRESGVLDARRLIRETAALRPVQRLPRRKFVTWAPRAALLVDRRQALAPFWDDAGALLRSLSRLRGRAGLRGWWLDTGSPLEAGRRFESFELEKIQLAPGAPILVIGDLGQLGGSASLAGAWLAYGRRLRAAGHRCHVLAPCPRDRWKPDLAQVWISACWDRGERTPRRWLGLRPLPKRHEDASVKALDSLLALIAPASRVEPGLLRSLRLLLPGTVANVGIEYDAWHHPEADRAGLAMALLPEAAIRRRCELTAALDPGRLPALVELYRQFHDGPCGPVLWAWERIHLAEAGASAGELAEAWETIRRANATMSHVVQIRHKDPADARREAVSLGLFEWQRRAFSRVAPEKVGRTEVAEGWAIHQAWSRAVDSKIPEGIDPKFVQATQNALEQDPGLETIWEVRQIGPEFSLRRWQPSTVGSAPAPIEFELGSPLTSIRARRLRFDVILHGGQGDGGANRQLRPESSELRFGAHYAGRIVVSSDCAEIELASMPRPPWARRWGQDSFGLGANFEVNGVRFPLRWIPPGSFLMGSPEDEKGRYPDEIRHRVTLTKGFWLATTPCTQRQWAAVMGNNPSEFKGDNLPVETVDWNACREFCWRLLELVPALDFRLPTEAEWEYACRAGTNTAFSDGSPCTEPDGKDPALEKLGWYAKNGEQKTHPVGANTPNSWGLCDMHGNVWEWCQDYCEWDSAASKVITDTYSDSVVDPLCLTGARRVVRGGSAWNYARDCRSACRYWYEPGYRGWFQGFRLASGQPVGSGAPPPEAPGLRDEAPGERSEPAVILRTPNL